MIINYISSEKKDIILHQIKIFDEQIEPVEFKLEQLIACWKEVILELNEGGEAFIVSPPNLGYGDHKLEDIPQNSILVFQLKIVQLN